MGQDVSSFRFGVKISSPSSFVVLDKSLLDGSSSAQLQYFAQHGWLFGIPEVLMFELLFKRDPRRIADLLKLYSVERDLSSPAYYSDS
jgi:hypothetical protein